MLARYIYRHARYLVLIIICILAVGINSFNSIPRQEDPELTNFVGNITTFFPGATPDRVEALVTRPLEDELRTIAEIKEMDSTSSSGVSFLGIRLKYSLPAEELDRVWSEVRDAMSDAARRFPPGVSAPAFDNDRFSSFTMIVALSAAGEQDVSLSILNRFAQDFADSARNLADTKMVVLFGEPEEEVRVEVDDARTLEGGQALDGREQLHAVVRRLGLAAVKLRLCGAGAEQRPPAAGAGVAAAGPVRVDLHRAQTGFLVEGSTSRPATFAGVRQRLRRGLTL